MATSVQQQPQSNLSLNQSKTSIIKTPSQSQLNVSFPQRRTSSMAPRHTIEEEESADTIANEIKSISHASNYSGSKNEHQQQQQNYSSNNAAARTKQDLSEAKDIAKKISRLTEAVVNNRKILVAEISRLDEEAEHAHEKLTNVAAKSKEVAAAIMKNRELAQLDSSEGGHDDLKVIRELKRITMDVLKIKDSKVRKALCLKTTDDFLLSLSNYCCSYIIMLRYHQLLHCVRKLPAQFHQDESEDSNSTVVIEKRMNEILVDTIGKLRTLSERFVDFYGRICDRRKPEQEQAIIESVFIVSKEILISKYESSYEDIEEQIKAIFHIDSHQSLEEAASTTYDYSPDNEKQKAAAAANSKDEKSSGSNGRRKSQMELRTPLVSLLAPSLREKCIKFNCGEGGSFESQIDQIFPVFLSALHKKRMLAWKQKPASDIKLNPFREILREKDQIEQEIKRLTNPNE